MSVLANAGEYEQLWSNAAELVRDFPAPLRPSLVTLPASAIAEFGSLSDVARLKKVVAERVEAEEEALGHEIQYKQRADDGGKAQQVLALARGGGNRRGGRSGPRG